MKGTGRRIAAGAITSAVILGTGAFGIGAGAASAANKNLTVMTFNASPVPGQDATLGLQAYIKSIDARGGIDGYNLQYKFCTLGTTLASESPNQAATCAHEAVADHVTAVAGAFDGFDNVTIPILKAGGIPYVGNFPMADIDFTSDWSTPLLASTEVLEAGIAQELVQLGHCKSLGLINLQGIPTEPEIERGISAVAKYFHVKFVTPQLIPTTVSDYGPAVTTLKSKGVDCLIDGFNSPQLTQPLDTAVRQAGIAHLGLISPALPTTVIKAMGPAANGIFAVESSNQDALVNNFNPGKINAAETQMLSDFKKYEPAAMTMQPLNYPSWGAGQMLSEVIKAVVAKHEAVTPANIAKMENKITIDPGVFPPSNFSQAGPVPGEPRVHATTLNYLHIVNDTLTPYDRNNHDVGPALKKYGGIGS